MRQKFLSFLIAPLLLFPSLAGAQASGATLREQISSHRLTALAFVDPATQSTAERATWRRISEGHRRDGLRIIAVVSPGPDGSCALLGWSPAQKICDEGGALRARFKLSSVPAAFLWSWKGALLVNEGGVADVERNVKVWLRDAPRVAIEQVDPRGAIPEDELRSLIALALQQAGLVTLVANQAEREAAHQAQRASMSPSADPLRASRIGVDQRENAQLYAQIVSGRLLLKLLNVDTKTYEAQGQAPWNRAAPLKTAQAAVQGLLSQLRTTERPERAMSLVVTQPASRAPTAAKPPEDVAPPAAWGLHGSVGAVLSQRTRLVNSVGGFGGGVAGHLEYGKRSPSYGFGLGADLGLYFYGQGVVEAPLRIGVRGYVWRLFVGVNAGMNIVDTEDDGFGSDDEMDEKITSFKHVVLAAPLGYSWGHWEVYLNLELQFHKSGGQTKEREAAEAAGLSIEEPSPLRARSVQLFAGWRF